MNNNVNVPPGVSGKSAKFDISKIDHDTLSCELALLNLGDFEPLNVKINYNQFDYEISKFQDDWVDYLPRTDRPNNRKGLTLTNLPGKTHKDNPSLAQASYEAGRRVSEIEFCNPTEVFNSCPSLHPLLNQFSILGRTFLVKCNTGGYFVPHRDYPSMPRDTFRIAVFLKNCAPLEYDWLMDDKKLNIELGRAYYINTRKTHRTISWIDDSIHLIVNVPMRPENVSKIISMLQHTH